MNVISDSEVGELWHKVPWIKPVLTEQWTYKAIPDLIRKLVEERQKYYEERGFLTQGYLMARRDFGIDPKEFK